MTVTGEREEMERRVLASLILDREAYGQLPEDFRCDAFEFAHYRTLFEQIRSQYESTHRPANEEELLERLQDFRALVQTITRGTVPLNGGLRPKAAFLMKHRPALLEQEAGPIPGAPTENTKARGSFHFEIRTGMEIVQMNIPEEAFLIRGLITEQSVNFLSGEEGCGKSLMAMNLAISVATGAPQWLAYDVAKKGAVIYLNNEMPLPAFVRRVKAMAEKLPNLGSLDNLLVPSEVPVLSCCWETLNELCEEKRPCLIILDCLYFGHDKDENDSSDMKALMRQFLALRDKFSTAVLLVHHTKKGSRYARMHNDQMRGSNVFGGITDTVLQMRRSGANEARRIIKPTKFRHVSDENRKCRLLSLDPSTLWFHDEGETDEGEHIAVAGSTAEEEIDFREVFGDRKEMTRREIVDACRPTGYDERTIDRLLKNAKQSGVLKTPRFGVYAL